MPSKGAELQIPSFLNQICKNMETAGTPSKADLSFHLYTVLPRSSFNLGQPHLLTTVCVAHRGKFGFHSFVNKHTLFYHISVFRAPLRYNSILNCQKLSCFLFSFTLGGNALIKQISPKCKLLEGAF